jgi:hypothetical protein
MRSSFDLLSGMAAYSLRSSSKRATDMLCGLLSVDDFLFDISSDETMLVTRRTSLSIYTLFIISTHVRLQTMKSRRPLQSKQ